MSRRIPDPSEHTKEQLWDLHGAGNVVFHAGDWDQLAYGMDGRGWWYWTLDKTAFMGPYKGRKRAEKAWSQEKG